MELKELHDKTLQIFDAENADELGKALFNTCINKNESKMAEFVGLVDDLSVDWLQMNFQYYQADRKVKMQDYTPKNHDIPISSPSYSLYESLFSSDFFISIIPPHLFSYK